MTTNGDSVANFFRETSYGQQLMNVTATPGWVTLSMAQPTTCGTTDWRNIGTNAEAAAKALGSAYDPAAYNFVVYVFPGVSSWRMERPRLHRQSSQGVDQRHRLVQHEDDHARDGP